MKTTDFFTKESANAPKKFYLAKPDGESTDEYLLVIGTDSDIYHENKMQIMRDFAGSGDQPKPEVMESHFVSGAITGWSFKQKFSREAVLELLINAPYIRTAVDKFASTKANFLRGESES